MTDIEKKIKTMDGFYEKYLPEFDKKYPINLRVDEEEQDLIYSRRLLTEGCAVEPLEDTKKEEG